MASFNWPDEGSGGGGGSGDVVGPANSTNNAVALFDGTSGTFLKNSTIISNAGAVSGITSLTIAGALSGITTLSMSSTLTGVTSITMNGALSGVTSLTMSSTLTGVTSITMNGALSGVTTLSMSGALTLNSLTASRAVYLNALKEMVSSTTSGTELNYITGVTSPIQTQLNAKIGTTLTNGNILVGSGANVATSVAMSGEATIINTGAVTLSNSAVIGKVLTGYASGAGTVAATDSILQSIQKLNGNDLLKQPLATLSTKGDLYVATAASTVTRLGAGTNGYVLKAASGATEGLEYGVPDDQSDALVNCSIQVTMASNKMTLAIKDKAGNNCSTTSPQFTAYRSATLTDPKYVMRTLTTALSLTAPNGANFGCRNGVNSRYYAFKIDASGVEKLAFCRIKLPEDVLYTTIAIGTGSNLSYELYSDAIYSNVAIRCVGQFDVTQATAGVHATAANNILSGKRSSLPLQEILISANSNTALSITSGGFRDLVFEDIVSDDYSLYNISNGEITLPFTMKYSAFGAWRTVAQVFAVGNTINMYLRESTTDQIPVGRSFQNFDTSSGKSLSCNTGGFFNGTKAQVLKWKAATSTTTTLDGIPANNWGIIKAEL